MSANEGRTTEYPPLDGTEREALADDLHSHLGFYISEEAEVALVERIDSFIEVRFSAAHDLADAWQAEIEDDGDGLTPLARVLNELRLALNYPPAPTEEADGCECVGYTIRTDYGTGTEHDVDPSGCPLHEGIDPADIESYTPARIEGGA